MVARRLVLGVHSGHVVCAPAGGRAAPQLLPLQDPRPHPNPNPKRSPNPNPSISPSPNPDPNPKPNPNPKQEAPASTPAGTFPDARPADLRLRTVGGASVSLEGFALS